MVINKTWSMPNKETFSIKPIRELIDKYREEGMVIVDPFARNSDIGTITNLILRLRLCIIKTPRTSCVILMII